MRRLLTIFLTVLALALSAHRTASAADDLTAEEVRASIERGAAYLKSKQNKVDGNWAEYRTQPGGLTALCVLALISSGVDAKDESIQKALHYLRSLGKPKMTYATALQTMALVAADPSPLNKDKSLIRRNALYLASIQVAAGDRKGSWSYSDSQGGGDNSNTQFALLALHEAERVGVEVQERVWRLALEHWLRTQRENGGWGYFEGQPTSGSMTCAGIASVIICSGRLAAGNARVEGETIRCCVPADDTDRAAAALKRAMIWMGRNPSVQRNPVETSDESDDRTTDAKQLQRIWLLYYLYGMERAGRMTGQRFFVNGRGEKFDWYREGAKHLIREDNQDRLTGSWRGTGLIENDPQIGTALALLFLSKGRRPVVIADLKREPEGDWNRHGAAVGNLTRHVERKWGRDLTWQTVDSRAAGAEDLLQSPVLFISGQESLKLSDRESENLRAYVDAGGFIFAETCCPGGEFDRDFRALMKKLFPDSQLAPLPADHPIWFAETPVDPEETPLEGLNSCCRTSVVYCKSGLSCAWELANLREHEETDDDTGKKPPKIPAHVRERIERSLALGTNVLAYATGRELRDKLDIPQLVSDNAPRDTNTRNTLYVAKLKHAGGSDDAPSALPNLLAVMRQEVGLAASSERRLIGIADDALLDYPIAFMHGRRSFRLSDTERARLKQYLERGGFLFVDAICANEEFAKAFRREMAAMFRDGKLTPIAETHPLLTQEFRGYDVTKVTMRDPSFRAEGDPLKAKVYRTAPTLEALEIDGRIAVIFSPYDLSCALENSPSLECKGYDRRDAAKIGVNVLLYALQQ